MNAKKAIRVVVALLICAAGSLGAQPVGQEFRVNVTTSGDQFAPAVARIDDVGFFAVWLEVDPTYEHVMARRVNLGGVPIGPEFRVNTETTGPILARVSARVSSDAAGGFVVVWSQRSAYGTLGIFGQRFAPGAVPLGGQFQVNVNTLYGAAYPDVSSAPTGEFVVVWGSAISYLLGNEVFGRRYSSSGAPLGPPFRANTYTGGTQSHPRVGAAGTTFVVVWSSDAPSEDGSGVFGQRFAGSGGPLGDEFHVNVFTTGIQDTPAVAAHPDGSFVVAWKGNSAEDDVDGGVRARRYEASGIPVGSGFRVNTVTTGTQTVPDASFGPNGDLVIVWRSDDEHGRGIFGQRFAPGSGPAGPEFRVNTRTTDSQDFPVVAVSEIAGRFAVVWEGVDADGTGIFDQAFCRIGDANLDGAVSVVDILFMINTLFAGGPSSPGCLDVNSDDAVNVSDILFLINYLFAGGPAPA